MDKKLTKMNRIVNSALYNFNESANDRKNIDIARSQEFWSQNKQYENDIDNLLKRLKYIDAEVKQISYPSSLIKRMPIYMNYVVN